MQFAHIFRCQYAILIIIIVRQFSLLANDSTRGPVFDLPGQTLCTAALMRALSNLARTLQLCYTFCIVSTISFQLRLRGINVKYDLIIIGSGPAGLAAAIYAARAELNFVVLERSSISGGQVLNTYEVDNYPGIPGISGADLSQKLREHCDILKAPFISTEVKEVLRDEDNCFTVNTWEGPSYTARSIIAATGASHKSLGCPGEEELAGSGVSYCATCDGAFFKGADVAVVGGGDVAVEDAIYLARFCRKVYLIHRRDEFRAAASLVSRAKQIDNISFITDTVVNRILGDDAVTGVELQNKKTGAVSQLAVKGVFIAVGIAPATELFRSLAACNPAGYILADETCSTTCPGLFAAGDLRTKVLRQIITAAADGANAVTSVLEYLG